MADRSIRVTVVGGYLGAGKTTLVNHVLRSSDERVAVIVNDFGSIAVDAELIREHDGETISLTNGCVCCSMTDGLAAALARIEALHPRPERLVIEASGVADPASVAAYAHGPGSRLDAIVVVADIETVRQTSSDRYVGDLVLRQLRAADIIVVNKVDVLVPDQVSATLQWIGATNPTALVVTAEHAVVPMALLFGVLQPSGDFGHAPDQGAGADSMFSSRTLTSGEPVDRAALERFMEELPSSTVRVKGWVWLSERPDVAMIVQRVGRRWTLAAGALWSGAPSTVLVCIDVEPAGRFPETSWVVTEREGSPPSR